MSVEKLRCRVGDLAVIIGADNRCNIGNIVQIIAAYDGARGRYVEGYGHVWTVISPRAMTWRNQSLGKRFRWKRGPVPDVQLQPIRGQTPQKVNRQSAELETIEALQAPAPCLF